MSENMTTTPGLEERLRVEANGIDYTISRPPSLLLREAADEIDQLAAERNALRRVVLDAHGIATGLARRQSPPAEQMHSALERIEALAWRALNAEATP